MSNRCSVTWKVHSTVMVCISLWQRWWAACTETAWTAAWPGRNCLIWGKWNYKDIIHSFISFTNLCVIRILTLFIIPLFIKSIYCMFSIRCRHNSLLTHWHIVKLDVLLCVCCHYSALTRTLQPGGLNWLNNSPHSAAALEYVNDTETKSILSPTEI